MTNFFVEGQLERRFTASFSDSQKLSGAQVAGEYVRTIPKADVPYNWEEDGGLEFSDVEPQAAPPSIPRAIGHTGITLFLSAPEHLVK